jgi:hypothetical protein
MACSTYAYLLRPATIAGLAIALFPHPRELSLLIVPIFLGPKRSIRLSLAGVLLLATGAAFGTTPWWVVALWATVVGAEIVEIHTEVLQARATRFQQDFGLADWRRERAETNHPVRAVDGR